MRRPDRDRRTWSILFFPMGAVLLLAVVAFALAGLYALRRTAFRQTEENLRQFGYAVTHFLDEYPVLTETEELQRFCRNFGAEPDFRITIVGPDGVVTADSNADPAAMENHLNRPEISAALQGRETSIIRYSDTLGRRLVYYAVPYRGYVVRLAVTVEYVDVGSREIVLLILLGAVVLLAFALAVATLVSNRIILPLSRLEEASAEYARGRLDVPFDTHRYPREFTRLASAFSAMASSLKEKIGALNDQNRETEAILASMTEALVALDEGGLVSRVNPAAERLFGFDSEAARGMPLIQLVRNTDIVDFAFGRGDGEKERMIELRTGEREGCRWILARLSSVGSGRERLLVFHDVTTLKRLERIRKDFVANVSHELKTPITSIQGFIETLKEGALEDPRAARRFLDIMDQQSTRLTAIIDDLLAISRLEQEGTGAIQKERADAGQLLSGVALLCAEGAKKKRTSVDIECPEGLSGVFNPGLMEQALVNLVQNAVKYSPEGSRVTLRAERAEAGGAEAAEPEGAGKPVSGRSLLFTVADNGPGIPERYLERIFERFYRIDKGRSRDLGGTGLGLSIVRHIALAHGGTVSVRSREGEGSAFTVSIPLEG